MGVTISDPIAVQEDIKEKLAQFRPTWTEVVYTEKTEEVTRCHTWVWTDQDLPKVVSIDGKKTVPNQSFGDWLREQRTHRKLSQQELASALNISNSNLSRIESGVKEPTLVLLHSLAKHWGYSIDHLMLMARHPSSEMLEILASDIDGFLHWMNTR